VDKREIEEKIVCKVVGAIVVFKFSSCVRDTVCVFAVSAIVQCPKCTIQNSSSFSV